MIDKTKKKSKVKMKKLIKQTRESVIQRMSFWSSESRCYYTQMWKKPKQGRVRALINQIESHPYQDDLQADLRQNNIFNPFFNTRRRWSTMLEKWKTLTNAEQIPGYDAHIVSLIGQKVLKTVLVEFVSVIRTRCVDWIEKDLMHYRFWIVC